MVSAVALERSGVCQICGTADHEWEADPFAYEPLYVTCVGCMKKEAFADDDTKTPKGTTIRLVPKATAERMRQERAQREAMGISNRPRRRRNNG